MGHFWYNSFQDCYSLIEISVVPRSRWLPHKNSLLDSFFHLGAGALCKLAKGATHYKIQIKHGFLCPLNPRGSTNTRRLSLSHVCQIWLCQEQQLHS